MFSRIVVVTKPTELEDLLRRHQSRGQVRFYLERRGTSYKEYEAKHATYKNALETVIKVCATVSLPKMSVSREMLPNFLFRKDDLVIVVGPEGLCANTVKYLDGQPILAINPDPKRIDGILMRFAPESVAELLPKIINGQYKIDSITLAKAETNDGQTLYAVNDFLIGRRDQVSAYYSITYCGKSFHQSSSGVLISTGVGSSGWMSSVIKGANKIALESGQCVEGKGADKTVPFQWNENYLLFAVREPFPSKYTDTSLVFGRITTQRKLKIVSEMPEGGVVFSDGVPEDALEFNSGTAVTITVALKTGSLISPLL